MARLVWTPSEVHLSAEGVRVDTTDAGNDVTIARVRSDNWNDTYIVYVWSAFHGANVSVKGGTTRASLASAKTLARSYGATI